MSQTIMHGRHHTQDPMSESREKMRTDLAHEEIQEADEQSLMTHQVQTQPEDYRGIEFVTGDPRDSQESLQVGRESEAFQQKFHTLNPQSLQTNQQQMFASSTNNSLGQGQPTPADDPRADSHQVLSQ